MFDKTEFKISVINGIGADIEDLKEGANNSLNEAKGAHLALKRAAKNVLALVALADKDLEKSDIPDLESLNLVKVWLNKAYHSVDGLAEHYIALEQQAAGALFGITKVVNVVSKKRDSEIKKLENKKEAIEKEEKGIEYDRTVGVRPAKKKSIKQIRLEEEQARLDEEKYQQSEAFDSMSEEELEQYLLNE